MHWKTRSRTLELDCSLVVGILNLTPDSFYDGGQYLEPTRALGYALDMVQDGADLLDLGAESTRPNAPAVSERDELNRLLPILDKLLPHISIPISIDTTKASVARAALERGVDIINDVSGLTQDPEMAEVVHEFGAGIVVMHRRGTPETMQSMTQYGDLIGELSRELMERVAHALACGIQPDQIVVDPGIGFSKTAEQNLEMIDRLDEFHDLGYPILIGPSRKSFIGHVIKQDTTKRLFGTVAACVLARERGVKLFRVHDVHAVCEALSVTDSILASQEKEKTSV